MRRVRLVSLAALTLVTTHAVAQVLHEPVTIGTLTCKDGVCTGENGQVRAIQSDPNGGLLYAPEGSAQAKPGEQIFSPQPDNPVEVGGAGGSAPGDRDPDRRDVIRSDRDTGPEGPGTHYYHVVFNPDPYPFKRMTALDSVRITPCQDGRPNCDDEVLEVFDRDKRALRVTGDGPARLPLRDLFWGSIVIDLEPGRWVPIPSVAADARILQYTTEPKVAMEFSVDGAGNVYTRSSSGGRHRLNWLSDAPRSYFAGELPRGVKLGDMPPALLRPVPERLRKRAKQVMDRIGIKPTKISSLQSVLDPLVAWFRAFEVGTLPPASGSSYLDLAMAQKGCCRHRSFAFTITAIAAGIPARYVENELHVFVEVYLPRAGWRRINLGGAPLQEELLGGQGKTLYKEPGADPFPQPPAFANATAPTPKGLAELQNDGQRSNSSGGNGKSPDGKSGNGAGVSGNGTRGDGPMSNDGKGPDPIYSDAADAKSAIKLDLDALDRADEAAERRAPRKAKTRITVEIAAAKPTARHTTLRGESVELRGAVTADGTDAGGMTVELYLVGPGGTVPVAEAATAADGKYHATIEVPRNLALGDHRVAARVRGDDRRLPCSTRRTR